MSASTVWYTNANKELRRLMEQHEKQPLTGGDAWRALVLNGRLAQSLKAEGAAQDDELAGVLSKTVCLALSSQCSYPEPHLLLEELELELRSEEDPLGPLLDSLLNLDDLCTVYFLFSRKAETEQLIELVSALLSLFPERLHSLSEWAHSRLQTLPDGLELAAMWEEVFLAPGQILIEKTQPQSLRTEKNIQSALERLLPQAKAGGSSPRKLVFSTSSWSFLLPQLRLPAAAASISKDEDLEYPLYLQVEDREQEIGVFYLDDDGILKCTISMYPKEHSICRVALQLSHALSGQLQEEVELTFHVDGAELILPIGRKAGPESLLQKLLIQNNLSPENAEFKVIVVHEN